MQIFKNQSFTKFARKERISDAKLCEVIRNAEAGKIDADYGGGLIKQRISRLNQGKSGGYRSIIYYRKNDKAFFVHGFSKNKQDNISDRDVRELKELAKITFSLNDAQITILVKDGIYEEVIYND